MNFEKDPVQGLIDLVLDAKPYHTKIIDVFVEYRQSDDINVTISDNIEFLFDFCYDVCPTYYYNYLLGTWNRWYYDGQNWGWITFTPLTTSHPKHDIVTIDTNNKIISIVGDFSQYFKFNTLFNITQSTGNDGTCTTINGDLVCYNHTYVVESSEFDGINTHITVFNNIASSVPDGIVIRTLTVGEYWQDVQSNDIITRDLYKWDGYSWNKVESVVSNSIPKMPDPHGTIIYTTVDDDMTIGTGDRYSLYLEDVMTTFVCDFTTPSIPWGGGIQYNVTVSDVDNTVSIIGNQFWPSSVEVGDQILFFVDSGSLPSPLLLTKAYYIIPLGPNTFKVAETLIDATNNVPIDITSPGSGNISVYKLVGASWDHCGWDTRADMPFLNAVDEYVDGVSASFSELITSEDHSNFGSPIFDNTVQVNEASTSFQEAIYFYTDLLELHDTIGINLVEVAVSTTADNPDVTSLLGSWDGSGFDIGGWDENINTLNNNAGNYPAP